MSSTDKPKVVAIRLGDSVLAELKGPKRTARFQIGRDYFWANVGSQSDPKWEKTQDQCLLMKLGQRSGMRFEPTKKNIDTIIEALMLAKKELL